MSELQHQLQWRGRAVGPWSLSQIRQALASGEIHSLYQIQVNGQWLALRDHLEAMDATELEQRAAQWGAHLRQKATAPAASMQPRERKRIGIHGPVIKPDPFGKAPPVFIKSASSIPSLIEKDGAHMTGSEVAPTCWLAVAAFVVSCASFVPYLNLVSWVPAIVLGHLSLRQIQRQPDLEGRGLALGAVIIGYATLTLAIVTAFFAPAIFYRIFPIGDA